MGEGCKLSMGSFSPMGWPHAASVCVDEQSNELSTKVDLVNTWLDWLEADPLSAEGSADHSHSSTPAHAAVGSHTARGPTAAVAQFRQRTAISSSTFPIEAGRHLLLQRFMRAVMVVVMNETRTALLLSTRCRRRWRSDFGFINSMHLFVSAVVLRASSTRELHLDIQEEPPGRESRKIQSAIAGKGSAVVHSDNFRLPKLAEQPLKILLNRLVTMPAQTNAQHVTAKEIAHGQRIDPLPIAGAKPAFEIDRPHMVRSLRHGQGPLRPWRSSARGRLAGPHQPQPTQPIGDGAYLWQMSAGMAFAQSTMNLLGPPAAMTLAQRLDLAQPSSGRARWRVLRTSRTIAQTRATFGAKTRQPFETSLLTDLELAAEVSNRIDATHCRPNKALSRFH